MSKRKQWISLMLLISLLITIGAGAETSLPGQITMMSYSDGELYFQVETYPTASIYRYTPATMQQPELIRNDFQAEQDIVFVVHGICYLWNGSDALIAKDESGERISLHIQEMSQRGKNYMPFLVSVCSENTLTWIMSYGESLTLCHLDLATNAFKSLDMGVGLFAVQPYQEGKSLVAVPRTMDGKRFWRLTGIPWRRPAKAIWKRIPPPLHMILGRMSCGISTTVCYGAIFGREKAKKS